MEYIKDLDVTGLLNKATASVKDLGKECTPCLAIVNCCLLGHDTVPYCIPRIAGADQDLWRHTSPVHSVPHLRSYNFVLALSPKNPHRVNLIRA